jgi:hypothetical protein
MMDKPDYSREALWRLSVAGFRANLIPGIVLWFVGLGVALAYYKMDSAKGFFDEVMRIKQTHGFLYSFLATGLFGGLIPFLYLWAAGKIKKGMVASCGAFFIFYWAFRGVEVDAFYRLQSILFGDGLDWPTIATKVFVDQFVYCIVWSAPITATSYGWKDAGFSWSRFCQTMTRQSFLFEIARLLLTTWILWIPATAIIYSLPLALQVPLFNLTLCFFVLLVSVFSKDETAATVKR